MTTQKQVDRIRGLKIYLNVNGKWLEVLLSDEKKKMIFKLIDKDKIVLKP